MVFLYVTCRNLDEAKAVSRALIERKAAGWVNISPVQAVYRSGDGVKEVDGAAIIIKTIESKVQNVEDTVREFHRGRISCIASFSLYRLNREYKDGLINTVA